MTPELKTVCFLKNKSDEEICRYLRLDEREFNRAEILGKIVENKVYNFLNSDLVHWFSEQYDKQKEHELFTSL